MSQAMLIVCPTCATTYQIKPAALGVAGRSVRCSHCKNSWFAAPESVTEEFALASSPVANGASLQIVANRRHLFAMHRPFP